MTLLVFIYVYHIDMNIEQLMPCSKKHNLHLKNILSSSNKSKKQSTFKSKQQRMTISCWKYNALYNLIFSYLKLFFFKLLTESLYICCCQLHQSSDPLLVESTLIYFFFDLSSYLGYFYVSSTHCIYIFTFNSDILSFGM